MAALAPRVFAAALLEGDDFRPAALLDHLGRNRGACDRGGAECDAVAAHNQDLAEFNNFAGLALDLVDLEHVLSGNAVLLTARFEDREHLFLRVRSRRSDIFRTGFLQSMPGDGCWRAVTGLSLTCAKRPPYGGTPSQCQEMANCPRAAVGFRLNRCRLLVIPPLRRRAASLCGL